MLTAIGNGWNWLCWLELSQCRVRSFHLTDRIITGLRQGGVSQTQLNFLIVFYTFGGRMNGIKGEKQHTIGKRLTQKTIAETFELSRTH